MKVLYLSSGNLFGGIETLLLTFARCRDLCPGLEPEFALCFDQRFAAALRETNVPLHILGPARMSRPWQVWSARRRLRNVLGECRPDVAVCHGSWAQALLGPAVREAGIPLVYWTHDRVVEPLPWQEKWAQRCQPDFVIANSHYSASGQGKLFRNIPSRVLYCALSAPERRYSQAERENFRLSHQTPLEVPVLLQVSRLDPHKGHLLHLEALRALRHMPWISWIVASPQRPAEEVFLAELKRKAEQLGLADRVRFLGWQADVGLPMEAADIFLQPNSGPEPFGLTFVEALYRERPVVTTAMAGALEVVSSDCGVLTPPGDVASLSAALETLLTDSVYRSRLGAHGPARARLLCDPAARLAEMKECFSSLRKA